MIHLHALEDHALACDIENSGTPPYRQADGSPLFWLDFAKIPSRARPQTLPAMQCQTRSQSESSRTDFHTVGGSSATVILRTKSCRLPIGDHPPRNVSWLSRRHHWSYWKFSTMAMEFWGFHCTKRRVRPSRDAFTPEYSERAECSSGITGANR